MKSLHISLNIAHSGCKPSTFMSSSTHSPQVFLLLPLYLTPATSTFLQANTQSSTLLQIPKPPQSATPHHIHHTLYAYIRLFKSTLRYLSSATLRTSISPSSALSSPDYADFQPSSPMFQSHMSTLSGHKPCISFRIYSQWRNLDRAGPGPTNTGRAPFLTEILGFRLSVLL